MPDARSILVLSAVLGVCALGPSASGQVFAPERPPLSERIGERVRDIPGLRNVPGLNGQPFAIPGLNALAAPGDDESEEAQEPSAEALAAIGRSLEDPKALVGLGLGWLDEERWLDAAAAFVSLRGRHPDLAAMSLYNEGCVHYAAGDRALAERMFELTLAEPGAERIHRLATFNLGSIRLDRVANRRDEVLPGLDPIRTALQSGPASAWRAYDEAVQRSIDDLAIASAMFRAALLVEPSDSAAMDNLRYARSKIIELRREREAKRLEFEEFLEEIILPQDALQKIMDLSERQRELADATGAAERERGSDRAERVSGVLSDQQRVTAETEDLLRRLDAMARRSEELFGEQNPLFAQLYDQLLNTGADAIADAVGAQRWADFELRGDELEAARDLQMQAHEDLRSIIEDFAAQVDDLQELMEMFAEQMRDQIEQIEMDFEGELPEQPMEPGEMNPMPRDGGAQAEFAERILDKEQRDTGRRDAAMRRDRSGEVEKDW